MVGIVVKIILHYLRKVIYEPVLKISIFFPRSDNWRKLPEDKW